jgi:His/Glu/Gln/Arg/opine family amino acid ABC transporter permease subunit
MSDFNDLIALLPALLEGASVTVAVSVASYLLALCLGLLLGLARTSRFLLVRGAAGAYVQFMRGTPLLLQLFFIYYVLPYGGLILTPFQAGVLGLTLNYAAYMAEVFRSGIAAVPKGQFEAGASLALTNYQLMRYVVIPQALKIVVPPIGNFFVAIFKDSALVSVITMKDLMFTGQILAASTFMHFQIFAMVAVIYLILSYPAAKAVELLERRLDKQNTSRAPGRGKSSAPVPRAV